MSINNSEVSAQQAELFQLVVENVKEYAIFLTDQHGTVISWNLGVERLLGYTEEQIVGQSIEIIFTAEDRTVGIPGQEMEKAARTGCAEDKRWHERRDGSRFWANGMVFPLKNEDGTLRGFSKIMRDDTAQKLAEDKILQTEARYRTLIETIATTVWRADAEGELIFIERNGDRISNHSIDEALKWGWLNALHPDDRERTKEVWQKALKDKTLYTTEFRILNVSNEYRWFAASAVPIFEADGTVREWIGINTDITERKRTEANLAFLAEISSSLVRLTKTDEITQVMSAKIGDYLGVTSCLFAEVDTSLNTANVDYAWRQDEQIVDLTGHYRLSEFISDEYGQELYAGNPVIISDVAEETSTAQHAAALQRLDISAFINTPFVDEGYLKLVLGVYCRVPYRWREDEIELLKELVTRIGTRIKSVRAEEQVRRSEEKYRMLFDSIDEGFTTIELIYDDNGMPVDYLYIETNPAQQRMTGLPKLDGKRGREVIPDIEESWIDTFGRIALSGEAVRFENYMEGVDRWFDVHASRIGGEGSRRVALIYNDVSERKRTEISLRESEARFRQLSDQSPMFIWQAEENIKLTYVNRAFLDFLGLKHSSEFDGQVWEQVIHPDEIAMLHEIFSRSFAAREPYSVELRLKEAATGEYRWLSFKGAPRLLPDGELVGFIGTGFDIHERKLAEEALRRSEERYRTLFNSIDEGFCVIEVLFDEKGEPYDYRYHEVNPAFEKLSGLSAADALQGKTMRQMVPDFEEKFPKIYGQVVLTGKAVHFTEESPALGRWFEVHASRIERAEDRLVSVIFSNITERKNIELEREKMLSHEQVLRAEAETANRLKDEFLATLSHELRTPLSSILGWSKILLMDGGNDEATRKALETISRNAETQKNLIEDILDVSRIISGKLQLYIRSTNLAEIINSAVETIRPSAAAKNIRLQTLLDPGAGMISGDPDRLQQVVWNLLSNAVKFSDKNEHIHVRLERIHSHVEMTVSDTGNGIEAEFLPFVFDRFRQSDGSMTRKYGGLGLGLAIVQEIVELHGGTVSVKSEGLGAGSIFTVSLPLLPIESESASEDTTDSPTISTFREPKISPEVELAGLHLLIVDDEADSLTLLKTMIEMNGAKVTTASSAAEALTLVKAHQFDVIVSDIGMPGEDGFSLIGKIRQLSVGQGGNTPAIALTAYARSEDRIAALRAGFQMHLAKPAERAELIAMISALARMA